MYTIFNTPGPNFSNDHAIAIAKKLYDLKVSVVKPLSSDRDQNFLLYLDDNPIYILKISHPAESFNVLDMKNLAIKHIRLLDTKIQLPKEVKNVDGDYISLYKYSEVNYFIRLVDYIPGKLMKDIIQHDKSFINMLGFFL